MGILRKADVNLLRMLKLQVHNVSMHTLKPPVLCQVVVLDILILIMLDFFPMATP